MENKIMNNDIAFSNMIEAMQIMNQDEEEIADISRELERLKKKKEKDSKRVYQYAANYFSEEKISELYELCATVLKTTYFNKEEYIERFSDATKVSIDDIQFLVEIQNNIVEVQTKLNSNNELSIDEEIQINGMAKVMYVITDIFSRKDGSNNG